MYARVSWAEEESQQQNRIVWA